jgi:hypothetical protein
LDVIASHVLGAVYKLEVFNANVQPVAVLKYDKQPFWYFAVMLTPKKPMHKLKAFVGFLYQVAIPGTSVSDWLGIVRQTSSFKLSLYASHLQSF